MPTIEAKWLGKNIHEDSTHRLVTDDQIAKWDINPDYNQNDETRPDYIKNRPCYIDGEYVLLDEMRVTTNKQLNSGEDIFNYSTIPISNLLGKSIILGESYIINVDGTEYPYTPWVSTGSSSDDYIGMAEPETLSPYGGSTSITAYYVDFCISIDPIFNYDTDKRIPFSKIDQRGYEYIVNDTGLGSYAAIYFKETVPTTHTIKIYKVGENHQLDEIYIPETIARKSYIDLTNDNYLDYAKITDDDGDHINIRNMPSGEYHIAFSELMSDNAPLLKLLKISETSDIFNIIDAIYEQRLLNPKYSNPKNVIINIKTGNMDDNSGLHNYQNITLDVYIDNVLCDFVSRYKNIPYLNMDTPLFPRNIIMKFIFDGIYNHNYDEDDYTYFTFDTIEGDVDYYPNIIVINSLNGIELDRVFNPGTYRMITYDWPMDRAILPFNPFYSTLTVTTTLTTCVQRVFDTYNFCEYIRLNSYIDMDNSSIYYWGDWAKIDYKVPDSCKIGG